MSASDDSVGRANVRKRNCIVIVTFALGIVIPGLHMMFLARYLPNWLNVVIIGGVFWLCFLEIIPANAIGVFRRKK